MKNEVDLFGNDIEKDVLLRDKFIEPPFSVLDTKSGNWQRRKKLWNLKGIKSELGRDSDQAVSNLMETFNKYDELRGKKNKRKETTVSIFDPALCELMYKWFCPENGKILDPFAGGSVRGIVAHYLDYYYTGLELRQEQVEANRENALDVLKVNNQPQWYSGDSDLLLDDNYCHDFDFIFSCPPYMDLEIYSDDENDLSNMNNIDFIKKYDSIIKKSCNKLKENCFACFVVGDIRDKKTGFYKDFIGITKESFKKAGMFLYNDIILLDQLGTACMRANNTFKNKKVVKIHQNVLVFKKG